MEIEFRKASFNEIRGEIVENLKSYAYPVDSYYEDHVIESDHYGIYINKEKVGYASIFGQTMLTQFSLQDSVYPQADLIFKDLVKSQGFSEIYVSTSDQLLLLMALDHFAQIEVQDLVFTVGMPMICPVSFKLEKAQEKDIPLISAKHEGFFPAIDEKIARQELFIGYMGDQVVSFGIIEASKLFPNLSSLGMFVISDVRGQGYGAMTISKLMERCKQNAIEPIAGCFAKNQSSSKALLKAGMIPKSRLLKVQVNEAS